MTSSSERPLQPQAVIVTDEPWHPATGYSPPQAGITVDETFSHVISELGRDGITWLRLHIDGLETWFNLAHVVTINEAKEVDPSDIPF